jgi:hypothetical protein
MSWGGLAPVSGGMNLLRQHASVSLSIRVTGPGKRVRAALPWAALAIGLGAVAGLVIAAQRAERDLLDRSNSAVARTAEAYLSAVTPAPGGRYDPVRLVSGAGALAGSSFWPGGIQVAIGRTPLLADTLGLVPLGDSIMAVHNATTAFALPRGGRASVTPFLDRARVATVGWVAAWDTLAPLEEPRQGVIYGIIAFVAGVGLGVAGYFGRSRLVRDGLVLVGAGAAALLGMELRSELAGSARAVTGTHLLLGRRALETAATADGVRSGALLGLAPGLSLVRAEASAVREDSVAWRVEDKATVGSLVARPPVGPAFRLTGVVPSEELGRADQTLLGVWCLLLVAYLAATEAGPRRKA